MTAPRPHLRRLGAVAVLGALLAGLLTALAQAPALACDCVDSTLRQSAGRADVVLRGRVLEQRGVEPARAGESGGATYVLEVDRVWKGTVDATDQARVEVSSSSGEASCGLGRLPEGRPVLLFATTPRSAGGELVANLCGGTTLATTSVVTQVERLLGEGTPVEPEPEAPPAVTGTVVGAEGEVDVVRLAAPGAAVALVGLLGLLVARRRA